MLHYILFMIYINFRIVFSALLTLTLHKFNENLGITRMCQDTARAFTPSHSQTHKRKY